MRLKTRYHKKEKREKRRDFRLSRIIKKVLGKSVPLKQAVIFKEDGITYKKLVSLPNKLVK